MHKFVTEFPYQPIQFNPRKAHMNRKLSHMKTTLEKRTAQQLHIHHCISMGEKEQGCI